MMSRRTLVAGLAAAGLATPVVATAVVSPVIAQNATPSSGSSGNEVTQAPALPGAQPISGSDRVYTADQTSNTISVIDPSTNTLLGTIPLGQPRSGPLLSAVYYDEVDVHGLGFAGDGSLLDAISVTTNAATLIDPTTNLAVGRAYLGRAPHEGFISPDGSEL